jgi:hypothetical protein
MIGCEQQYYSTTPVVEDMKEIDRETHDGIIQTHTEEESTNHPSF